MENEDVVKKLKEFEGKAKHEISPCDLGSGDYAQIKLNKEDALKLKELLNVVLKQL